MQNENRDLRVVVLPETCHWVLREEGDLCRLESIPGIMETSFFKVSPKIIVPLTRDREDREILVLEGSIEILGRTWPSGSYLRFPAGSGVSSFQVREEGSLLFIKSGRFPEEDSQIVGIVTEDGLWRPGLVDGLNVLPLWSGGTANTAFVRWDPGTVFQPHRHFGGEEILVMSGVFEDELGSYPAGAWVRSPHMSRHDPFSTSGCTIFVKTGHIMEASRI